MSQRVLIVDDNEDVRRILGLRFQLAGYCVREAADGAEGLDALRHGKWDLVLLDLFVPGVDGFKFLRELRTFPGALPAVVVFTQYDEADHQQKALELGAMRYVAKDHVFGRGFAGAVRRWMDEARGPFGSPGIESLSASPGATARVGAERRDSEHDAGGAEDGPRRSPRGLGTEGGEGESGQR